MSINPNPLNSFRTYNYRWSMGVLTARELANPMSYKTNGGSLIFIRSGGLPEKQITTFIEDELGINVEFFIDEVEFTSLISPNPGTSTSNAIQLEFTVIEPYSIGLFFQTLALAAQRAGYRNYIESPFILSLDFVGHKDDGNTTTTGKKTFAIKIVNVTFTANAGGSVYNVQAIPFNHVGFLDDYQEVNKNVSAVGDTAGQVLDNFVSELNRQEDDLVLDGTKLVGNRYKISFPTLGAAAVPVNASLSGSSSLPANQIAAETAVPLSAFGPIRPQIGSQTVSYDEFGDPISQAQAEAAIGLDAFGGGAGTSLDQAQADAAIGLDAFGGSGALVIPGIGIDQRPGANSPSVFQLQGDLESNVGLDAFGGSGPTISVTNNTVVQPQFDPTKNEMGNSLIIPNFNEFGNVDFADENEFYNTVTNIIEDARFTIDQNSRVFEFSVGSKIEKIIEGVILQSTWGREIVNQQPDANSMVNWFKIDLKTTIISEIEMQRTGRPAMQFEFVVNPYKISYERLLRPDAERNYDGNIQNAKKAYHYSYTGLNTDIIDFDFKIDNSFYKPWIDLQADPSRSIQFAASQDQTNRFGMSVANEFAGGNNLTGEFGIQSPVANFNSQLPATGGMGGFTDKRQIAEAFNLLVLNSDVDNIQLDLTIWGDPWYLSDSDAGNYRASAGSLYEDADGQIDFQRSEIDVLVKFNSGVDIVNNLLVLDPINLFNGIYKIVTFTSVFKDGKFTQELKLLRRPGQSVATVDAANAIIEAATAGRSNSEAIIKQVLKQNTRPVSTEKMFGVISAENLKTTRLGDIRIESFAKNDPIGGIISQVGGVLGNLGGFGGQILSSISGSANAFQSLFNVTNLVPGLSQTLSGFQSTISGVSGRINQISSQFGSIANTITGSIGDVASQFQNVGNAGSLLNQISGQSGNQLSTASNRLTGQLASQLNNVTGNFGNIAGQFNSITSQLTQPLQQLSSASNAINNLETSLSQGLNLKSNLLDTVGQTLNLPNPIQQNLQQLQQSLNDPQAFMSQVSTGAIQEQAQKLLGPELRQKIQEVEKLTGELKNLEATLNQKISTATRLFDNVGKASTKTQDNIIQPNSPFRRLGPS